MKSLTTTLFAAMLVLGISNAFAQKTEDRHLSGFNAISVGGSYDVYVTQGSTESVKVVAPEDEMEHIVTEVQNGVLKIYNRKDDWNWSWGGHKKEMVYVTIKEVNAIGVSGSGDVFFKDGISSPSLKLRVSGSGDVTGKLDVKTLESHISGSGDMKLSGKADDCTINISGSGDYTARDLVTINTAIHVSGSGDASVNASQKIDASVSGSGDIKYTGSATQVSISKHGSGSVHRG